MNKSIAELRKICQNTRIVKGRTEQHWINKLYRKVSIYITWILLQTNITANQITFYNVILAIIASFFISSGNWPIPIILLFLINLLDHSDGEIARYRKTSGKTGLFFDGLVDRLIHPIILIGFAIASFNLYSEFLFLVIGYFVIIMYFVNYKIKEYSKEYETKQFHQSIKHSFKLIGKDTKTTIIFMGSSKHLLDLIIVLSLLASNYSFILVFYFVFLALSIHFRIQNLKVVK